ncbi:MAG: NAD(P)H-binding protein, partial [Microbacterium sp.]|nr:NAD(P)H-binding protein [Microbacterium sp.]
MTSPDSAATPSDRTAAEAETAPADRTADDEATRTGPSGNEETLRAVPRADGTPPRALVLGATGYIGGRLVPRLLAAGYRVRVLARHPERAEGFSWGGEVEIVAGDATDPDAVARATADVDVLYYLVHSMATGGGFEDSDRKVAQVVAAQAARARVGRIVYLG